MTMVNELRRDSFGELKYVAIPALTTKTSYIVTDNLKHIAHNF